MADGLCRVRRLWVERFQLTGWVETKVMELGLGPHGKGAQLVADEFGPGKFRPVGQTRIVQVRKLRPARLEAWVGRIVARELWSRDLVLTELDWFRLVERSSGMESLDKNYNRGSQDRQIKFWDHQEIRIPDLKWWVRGTGVRERRVEELWATDLISQEKIGSDDIESE